MAFGQQSGPPATHKQLQYLESLVRQAGHDGFRDARYPLGLTQRQAAGKFTRDEASALIEQLVAAPSDDAPDGGDVTGAEPPEHPLATEGSSVDPPRSTTATDAPPSEAPPGGSPAMARARARREAEQRALLADVPAELLAEELRQRGWAVTPP